jgi:sugar phosphate isomerase/epimerase
MNLTNRRHFLARSAAVAAAASLPRFAAAQRKEPLFKISLAQWSLHKAIKAGELSNRDFAKTAKQDYGIDGIEYVNQLWTDLGKEWMDAAKDKAYVGELKKRADDLGVKSLLIMCDNPGQLGDSDEAKRASAIEGHYRWVEAAKELGCHSIRVNARSNTKLSPEEQQKLVADGLRRLSEFAAQHGLNVIVENHGGLSSDGNWLTGVMKLVDRKNCGTLPDFGNFRIGDAKEAAPKEYDRYQGVDELMAFAKGVSAKSHDFDEQGNETHTDFFKMMDIVVKKHGYHGYCGIEYEGSNLSEPEGIRATKKLLERVREKMSA